MLRYCIFIAVFQEASESSRLDVYLKVVWSSWQGPLCTCVLQQLLHVHFRHPPWKAFPFLSFVVILPQGRAGTRPWAHLSLVCTCVLKSTGQRPAWLLAMAGLSWSEALGWVCTQAVPGSGNFTSDKTSASGGWLGGRQLHLSPLLQVPVLARGFLNYHEDNAIKNYLHVFDIIACFCKKNYFKMRDFWRCPDFCSFLKNVWLWKFFFLLCITLILKD